MLKNVLIVVNDIEKVTVHSVHSNVAKIHSRLPAAMEFWLVCLGIVVCEQLLEKSIEYYKNLFGL